MSQTLIREQQGREDAFPENVPGTYYVNTDCIGCELCSDVAPAVFRPTEDHDYNYVFEQPGNAEQVELAEEALDRCPVEAIVKEGGD